MKCVYCVSGSDPICIPMQRSDSVYIDCDASRPGFLIAAEHDVDTGLEFLSLHVAMSLYEGGEAAGSYERDGDFLFSWAVIPETRDEALHLAEHAFRCLYR